jgi:hypothetical protein
MWPTAAARARAEAGRMARLQGNISVDITCSFDREGVGHRECFPPFRLCVIPYHT